jgi:hypothetical protein
MGCIACIDRGHARNIDACPCCQRSSLLLAERRVSTIRRRGHAVSTYEGVRQRRALPVVCIRVDSSSQVQMPTYQRASLVVHAAPIRQDVGIRTLGAEFAVPLQQPLARPLRLGWGTQRTLAKYLHTLSLVLARSWLKGQEFPAWQAPWRKNLQGTWEVSRQRQHNLSPRVVTRSLD